MAAAWGPRGLLAASARESCEVTILCAREEEQRPPLFCCSLPAPVQHLCWAASEAPLLLAADITGSISLCCRPHEEGAFECTARFGAHDALRALHWLQPSSWLPPPGRVPHSSLPFGIEAFVAVGSYGSVALRWRTASASSLVAGGVAWSSLRAALSANESGG